MVIRPAASPLPTLEALDLPELPRSRFLSRRVSKLCTAPVRNSFKSNSSPNASSPLSTSANANINTEAGLTRSANGVEGENVENQIPHSNHETVSGNTSRRQSHDTVFWDLDDRFHSSVNEEGKHLNENAYESLHCAHEHFKGEAEIGETVAPGFSFGVLNKGESTKRYTLGAQIGIGSFSRVFMATDRGAYPHPRQVAVKAIDRKPLLQNPKLYATVLREVSLCKFVHHRNTVRFLDIVETRDRIFLVMELIRGGELYSYIEGRGRLPEKLAFGIFAQLLDVVGYLHNNNICHRDIKLENILLVQNFAKANAYEHAPPSPISPLSTTTNEDESFLKEEENGRVPIVKMADFGLARTFPPGERLTTRCGSEEYASPQLLRQDCNGYDPAKTDVWALGCVLYAMLTGEMAFSVAEGGNMRRMFTKICLGQYKVPDYLGSQAKLLVTRCLDPNETTRASVNELIAILH